MARALKTCGFKNLTLVNPTDITHPETGWLAHQSMDIVHSARIVPTFDQALESMSLVAGTTMRHRHSTFPFFTPLEISQRLQTAALSHPVAIVFGRESNGLSNEELFRCQLHTTIQTATTKPALNLAQSVMLYAHTFFMDQHSISDSHEYNLATHHELEKFYEHLQDGFDLVGFQPRDSMDTFLSRFRRLLGRAQPEKRDVRLLHKVIGIFEERVRELEDKLAEGQQEI